MHSQKRESLDSARELRAHRSKLGRHHFSPEAGNANLANQETGPRRSRNGNANWAPLDNFFRRPRVSFFLQKSESGCASAALRLSSQPIYLLAWTSRFPTNLRFFSTAILRPSTSILMSAPCRWKASPSVTPDHRFPHLYKPNDPGVCTPGSLPCYIYRSKTAGGQEKG